MIFSKKYSFLLFLCMCMPQKSSAFDMPISDGAARVVALGVTAAAGLGAWLYWDACQTQEAQDAALFERFMGTYRMCERYINFFADVNILFGTGAIFEKIGCSSTLGAISVQPYLNETSFQAFETLCKKYSYTLQNVKDLHRALQDMVSDARKNRAVLVKEYEKPANCPRTLLPVKAGFCEGILQGEISTMECMSREAFWVIQLWEQYLRYETIVKEVTGCPEFVEFSNSIDMHKCVDAHILQQLPKDPYPYVGYMEYLFEQQKRVKLWVLEYANTAYPDLHANLEKLELIVGALIAVVAEKEIYREQLADKTVADELRAQRERQEREERERAERLAREEREMRERERQCYDRCYYWHVYHHPCCDLCHCSYWYCHLWHDNYWERQRLERERVRIEQARLEEERRHNREMERQERERQERAKQEKLHAAKITEKITQPTYSVKPAKPFAPQSTAAFPEHDATTHYQPDFY